MPTITFKTNVTIHVPGKGHQPFDINSVGAVNSGIYVADKIPPGTEVTLDEDEARAIIARHGGEIIRLNAGNPAAVAQKSPGKDTGQSKDSA